MSSEHILFLALGACAGGFINGLSGTGTALFALGFYLVVLDPVRSVAIVALMSVIVGIQGLWIVRSEVLLRPSHVLRFVLPGLLGVPLGVILLERLDAGTLRLGIAAFLILYGVYFGFRAKLPEFTKDTPAIDGAVGLTGGVLGGALACWREGVIIDWVIWWGFWWLVSWVKMLHTTKMGGKVLSRSVGPLCGVACLLF